MIKIKCFRYIWQSAAFAALIAGCSGNSTTNGYNKSEATEITATIKEWVGKQLILPKDVGYFTTNVDSANSTFPAEEFKIVRYIGKGICLSCRLRLHLYPKMLSELSERAGCQIGFICIVNPADIKELRRTLFRENRAGLTMWIDETDSLNRINRFPEVAALQTFLVDGENRVLAVGDPAVNPRVMRLFVDVLRSDSIRGRGDQPMTELVADAEEKAIGSVYAGDTARCRFEIRNAGDAAFVLDRVITSCDCTSAQLSADTIPSGGSAFLDVVFLEREAAGDFVRTVSLFGNTRRELTVEITGKVKGQ